MSAFFHPNTFYRNKVVNVVNANRFPEKRPPKVLPSKLDWFPSTIEAFWEKNGRLWIFSALWNLT